VFSIGWLMYSLYHWFANPLWFALLALLPVLGVVAFFAAKRRRQLLSRFGNVLALKALAPRRGEWRLLRTLCLVAGLACLIAGIAGPRWGRDWETSTAVGRDLVIVLDLSRSMLAQDVLPSRVGRAKQALQDLILTMQRYGGHRIALVVFAARARIVCPLTHDYDHFRMALRDLDAAQLPPELCPAGNQSPSGTRIGAGLLAAVDAQDPRFKGFQDILLLSDGDDPARDGEWREGALAARARGIPIHSVGIGNPDAACPIPGADGKPLRFQGQPIATRLEERPLEEIAHITGATYTPARTNALPLGELFRERIEPRPAREEDDDALPLYRQRYPLFLGMALSLFSFEMLLGSRRRGLDGEKRRGWSLVWRFLLGVLTFGVLGAASSPSPVRALRQGNDAFQRGEYATALDWYTQAEERTDDPGQVAYDKAAALYQLGRFREAELHYRRCRQDAEGTRLAHLLYGLGNCLVLQARSADAARFREAISYYEQCLQHLDADAELIADARHNLELARLFWLKAKSLRDSGDQTSPDSESEPPPPPDPRNDSHQSGLENRVATPDTQGKPESVTDKVGDSKSLATPSDRPPPGKGDLPPIPDDDELAHLSPDDAAEHLQRAASRIVHEQQAHRHQMAPTPAPNVKNW
jgi:Ca-activated chloride channel family protein